MVGEDLVGDHVARHEPADDRRAGDRRAARSRGRGTGARTTSAGASPPGLPKLPVRIQSSLLRYEQSVLFGRLLDAEVLEHRRRCRRRRCAARRRGSGPRRRRSARRSRRRHVGEAPRAPASAAVACARRGTRGRRGPPGRATATSAARHQASVPGRTRRWKSASLAVSVDDGVDHDHRALGVLGDLLAATTRARGKLCDIHGFLPTNTRTSACSNSPRVCAAVEPSVDPGLAGLLLRQRARAVARAERAQERAAVAAAEVVALAAAAVVEDRLAAVLVARPPRSAAAISAIAVSQSISSKLPSGAPAQRRRQAVRPFW